jgi:hypothetical protein
LSRSRDDTKRQTAQDAERNSLDHGRSPKITASPSRATPF